MSDGGGEAAGSLQLPPLDVSSSGGGKTYSNGSQQQAGNMGTRSRSGSVTNSAIKAGPVFERMTVGTDGLLDVSKLGDFLQDLNLSTDYDELLGTIAPGGKDKLNLEEA